MSYLTLPDGIPNFAKAVISFWFRVPKDSAIAASKTKVDSGLENFEMLKSVLPLLTFGKPQKSKIYTEATSDVAVIHPYSAVPGEPDPGTTYNTIHYEEGPSYDVDPTYVGLFCNEDGSSSLIFHIQMGDVIQELRSTDHVTTKMDIWSGADPTAPHVAPGNGVVSVFLDVGKATIDDVSDVQNAQPGWFEVGTNKALDPDEWHHVLLSFDVGGKVAIGQ